MLYSCCRPSIIIPQIFENVRLILNYFNEILYGALRSTCTCPFWDISNQRFRLLLLKTLNDVMLEKSFKLTFRTPCDEHFIEKMLNYKSLKIKIFPETWWSMKSRPLTNKNGLSTFNNSLFILISRGVKTTKHLIQDSVLELCCYFNFHTFNFHTY